jgi:hypothetical protein
MCSDTNCWGFRLPHARIGGVLIVAQRRDKAHWHNILRGSAKLPTSTGESHCIRDRERVTIHTCRGGGLHPLYSTHQLIFAAIAALLSFSLFSSHTHVLSHTFAL